MGLDMTVQESEYIYIMKSPLGTIVYLLLVSGLTLGCKKDSPPSVVTSTPTFEFNTAVFVNGQLTFNTRLSMKGEVLSSGSNTKRGFVWAEHGQPTELDNSIYDSISGQGAFALLTEKFEFSKTYYVRAFAENSLGRVYGDAIEVTSPSIDDILFSMIGTPYQGGLIAHVDEYGHGIIVSTADIGRLDWVSAKQACDNLTLNGYSDWRLPDGVVLKTLYTQRDLIGGFETAINSYYWSSVEYDSDNAGGRAFFMNTNGMYIRNKNNSDYVRPIRPF
jgi:hypothetical protein